MRSYYLSGIICSNICEQQIKIAEPRHSLSENNDKIFVLSLDQSMNTTKCLWNFSTTSNFLLNLIFLNYTSLLAPAGSGCKTDYYLIRTFDLDTNTTSVSGPFCGQRQHGIRINGIISIELVAQKLQYVVGLSLAVLIEASSKGKLSSIFDRILLCSFLIWEILEQLLSSKSKEKKLIFSW